MALQDRTDPLASENGPRSMLFPDITSQGVGAAPIQSLERLSEIHHETSEAAGLARFLRSAVNAGALLMVLGALALAFAGGGGLQQEFVWALLVLAGVGAMLRSYIKSSAQAFDRTPLREAAKELRTVLFYTGFAWGAGAFLLLGRDPVPIFGLCFALLPTLFLALLVKDWAATLAFIAPVTLLTAAAIIVEPWSDTPITLSMLLLVEGSIVARLLLTRRSKTDLPAGLSLG